MKICVTPPVCVQGYTAAVRAFHKRPNLKKWTCFLWDDFKERNAARVTFKKRHLPLSDGKDHPEFKGLLQQPAQWLNPTATQPEKNTKPPAKRAKKEPNAPKPTQVNVNKAPPVVMMWDNEKNEMVPVVCIDDD